MSPYFINTGLTPDKKKRWIYIKNPIKSESKIIAKNLISSTCYFTSILKFFTEGIAIDD